MAMTDPEDKSGRHRLSWAERIPLVTLLAVVFATGGAAAFIANVRDILKDSIAEQKRTNDRLDVRLHALEDWRIQHDAVASPLMNQYLKDLERRKR